MYDIMLPAFAACVVLTGIHAYLGVHIIARGVIFVDLALAQIAALGAITGVLSGVPLHSTGSYFFSLGFTLLGAALFSLTRLKDSEVPQEAFIGIVYVVSAALAVMALGRIPGEAEHLKDMLVGNILFTDWKEIGKTALLYAGVGAAHYLFRDKFFAISRGPEEAAARGINVRFWDFVFYALFGVVVTSSVSIAGVLLVFTFLIVPAVCSIFFYKGIAARLIFGWAAGLVTSAAGLIMSYELDLPSGAAVVGAFGVLVVTAYLLRPGAPKAGLEDPVNGRA